MFHNNNKARQLKDKYEKLRNFQKPNSTMIVIIKQNKP